MRFHSEVAALVWLSGLFTSAIGFCPGHCTRLDTPRTGRRTPCRPQRLSPEGFEHQLLQRRRHQVFVQTKLFSSGMEDSWGQLDDEEEYDDFDDDERLSDEELEATMGEWDERVPRFNTVNLVGRIGNDPEPREFDDGNMVLNLSLAQKRKYHWAERKALNIEYGEEETQWFSLELWGGLAKMASRFAEKGTRVAVVGTLEFDTWNDRATGEERSRPKVIVRQFEVLESKAEAELRRSRRQGGYRGGTSRSGNDDGEDGFSPAGMGAFFE